MARIAHRSSSSRRRSICGLLAAAAWTSAYVAHADASADSQSLIAHGLVLRREHDDSGALAEFKRAYALEATPRCRAQIGLAEQSLGQWLSAEADLQGALATADDPWILKNRPKLEAALGFVTSHFAWIDIDTN